jgi:plastocyanin
MLVLTGASLALTLPIISHAQQTARAVALTLGDYAFSPAHIEVIAGQPVSLTLTNQDSITPHNFTLQDSDGGLDIDTDVGAGASVVVEFTPQVPGSYSFYCNKKLPFMKSHRDRGMEGRLTVTPAASD